MTERDPRQELVELLESEVRPLLAQSKYDDPPGYDCCGCPTYDEILDHAIRIVRGEQSGCSVALRAMAVSVAQFNAAL